MIESVLTRYQAGRGVKITVKALLSAFIVALAVALPQLVHLAAGAQGGVQWLPMYLPVLLGGCLLGWKWGLGIGLCSPLVSFAVTSLAGEAMPAAVRLPYMAAELAVFALVSGLFGRRITANGWMAFPAVLLAQAVGRCTFLALAAVFQSISPLSAALVWSQIQAGLLGMTVQAIAVPLLVMGLRQLLVKDEN